MAAPGEGNSSASGLESQTGQMIQGGQRGNVLLGDRLTPLILAQAGAIAGCGKVSLQKENLDHRVLLVLNLTWTSQQISSEAFGSHVRSPILYRHHLCAHSGLY